MDTLSMHRIKEVEVTRDVLSDSKAHILNLVIRKESGARVQITLYSNKYIALNFKKNSKKKGQ